MTVGTTQLYLARHGEQDRPPGGAGPGTGLSDRGRAQAALLGRRLSAVPFDVIRHSPLRRAAETAQLLAEYLPGVPAQASDLMADRTPVPPGLDLTGMPPEFRSFLDAVPDGERDPGAARLDDAVARLAVAGPADRRELLVTHNFVIGWFVRHALDAPPWRWIGLNQANCGLTIIEVRSGRPPMLICFNDTGHLPAG
jgi:serine/threonine-protein phosphatase PGAM5